jgi:hypothetical protein
MAVVHAAAGRPRIELVHERLAGRDRFLRQSRRAFHAVRNGNAVPVHGRALERAVLHDDTQSLALLDADRGAREGTVETPRIYAVQDFGVAFSERGITRYKVLPWIEDHEADPQPRRRTGVVWRVARNTEKAAK